MLGIELNLRRGAASRAVDRRRRGKALDGVPSGADDGLGRVLPVLVRAPAHLHEEHRVEAVAARHLDAAEVVAPRRPATAVGRDGIPRQRVRSGAAVLLVLRLVLESKAPRILARLFEAPRRPSQRRRLPSPPPRARDRRHHQRGAAERQRRREQHVAQRGHHERCSGCALRRTREFRTGASGVRSMAADHRGSSKCVAPKCGAVPRFRSPSEHPVAPRHGRTRRRARR